MTLPSKEDLRETIEAPDYRPALAHDLASRMGVEPGELSRFLRLLRTLESEGIVLIGKDNKISTPARVGMVTGGLSMTYRGHGFVTSPRGERLLVDESDLAGAIHGDTVLVKPVRKAGADPKARVLRVLKRGIKTITGIYEQHRGHGEVRPDDGRLRFTVFVGNDEAGAANDGDRVFVELTRYPEPDRDARGKVSEVIGEAGDPKADARAIALRFGFPLEFSDDALGIARSLPQQVGEGQISARLDLRNDLIVTIDGEDAKDFDDAVSLEKTARGWRLGVHIADVSSYVKPGTTLDAEAYARATSVYLHNFVLPMLPFELSNGICSLRPDEDRLVVSVFIDLDEGGKPIATEVRRAVIRSKARLTYESVNKFFEDGAAPKWWPGGLTGLLRSMNELGGILRERRRERGSLDFDFPEWKVRLDQAGLPVDVYQHRRGDAEKLIEEFMIACNEAIAAHLFHLGRPCMFRVHEPPDKKELDELNEIIGPLGYRVKGTNNPHPRAIQAVLDAAKNTTEEALVSDLTLRALKKARYAPVWLGHFGLASPMYCHFTSPIRRYPDLIVHRLLGTVLDGHYRGDEWARERATLDADAEHCSEREYAAQSAERESLENMKAQYMKNKTGEVFPAIISEVVQFGFFVELENGITGLVHVSSLHDGWYDFDPGKKTLRCGRTGRTFKVGQNVYVQAVKVDAVERKVDFVLVEEPE